MVPRENERDQNLDTYHESQHRGEGRKWGVAYVPYERDKTNTFDHNYINVLLGIAENSHFNMSSEVASV